MFQTEMNLNQPFIQSLACVAINPGLRSVLMFDTPYRKLQLTATILTQMLECTTGKEVEQVYLRVSELDDDLWGSLFIDHGSDGPLIVWRRGILANPPSNLQNGEQPLRLVIIPDLAKLSLAAARACVMLVAADVAYLERYGYHAIWRPNMCWLASCSTTEIGAISPHLLDRFALRLSWPGVISTYSAADLLKEMLNDTFSEDINRTSLTPDLKNQLQKAVQCQTTITNEFIERVLAYLSVAENYFPRREIALARLASSIAKLKEAHYATANDVDTAASLIGLTLPEKVLPKRDFTDHLYNQAEGTDTDFQHTTNYPANEDILASLRESETLSSGRPVYEPNYTDTLELSSFPTDPYPEDNAPINREIASLRLPFFQYAITNPNRGTVIGVERATTLHDIALVSTLFVAAPFQAIRRKNLNIRDNRFIISTSDLRRYLRKFVPQQMLLLLIDYTSLRGNDWQDALSPYLSWAYVERASVCIVQVGAAHPTHELRADLIQERSILVPSITTALEEKAGKATPLADGFSLALRTLRHALQHGRHIVHRALFVVVSDGRGNVSLEASHNRHLTKPLSREGIEDALKLAQQIGELKHIQTVLLNPQPKYHPDLPLLLAATLNAEVINITKAQVEGVGK